MSTPRGPESPSPAVEAELDSFRETQEGFEAAVRLRNSLDRAVHYISDVRGILYDPVSQRVTVQLSDRGRSLPPPGILVEPRFHSVDPHGEAIATIRLPKTIVRLGDAPAPNGDVVLEEHAIADAQVVDVEIGWADTPFYRDPREKRAAAPVGEWEQDVARVSFAPADSPEQSQ